MPNIEFSLQTNKIGSKCTVLIPFDDEVWEELTDEERDEYVKIVFWEDVMDRLGDWGWEVVGNG